MLAKLDVPDRHALAEWEGQPSQESQVLIARLRGLAYALGLTRRGGHLVNAAGVVAIAALVVVLAAAAAVAISSARSDGEATAAPTEQTRGERTGVSGVDSIIELVDDRDTIQLANLMVIQSLPCSDEAESPNPPCRGRPAGTVVGEFPIVGCHSGWAPTSEWAAARFMDRDPALHSVDQLGSTDLYEITYVAENPAAAAPAVDVFGLRVQDGGIVLYEESCGPAPSPPLESPFGREYQPRRILAGAAYP
jgi:hypothetical protein